MIVMNKGIEPAEKNIFFPLSSKYNEKWALKNSLGENVLFNLESLCEIINFKKGMRVLDLGCGKAISAIFLACEFDIEVWAVDNIISQTDNLRRIKEQKCEDKVFPLKLNAKKLPFAQEFFDVIIAADSYMYFGTDERYTPYITQFLKPRGTIGIVDICFSTEIGSSSEAPDYLKPQYQEKWYYVHSLQWWEKLMKKTGLLYIDRAEILPQNQFIKAEYIKDMEKRKKQDEIARVLALDTNNIINMFRLTAVRTEKPIT